MLYPKNCKNSEEQYEKFTVRLNGKRRDRVKYDYRNEAGELFSCIACSIEEARTRRDRWLRDEFLRKITMEWLYFKFVKADSGYVLYNEKYGTYLAENNLPVYFKSRKEAETYLKDNNIRGSIQRPAR